MQKLIFAATAIVLMAVGSPSYSQAVIVESKPIDSTRSQNPVVDQNAASASAQSELYFQLQMLQQEVQQLRGLVEEQAHEIRQLKQQQLDDYVDLDRRISQMPAAGGAAASLPSSTAANLAQAPQPAAVTLPAPASSAASPEAELASYDKAVRLIIKDKQLDAGADAMKAYINDYPNGVYLSNAQYWVGQVAYIQGDYEAAKEWFTQLLKTQPNSQKAPEAKYKLGTVLHKLGDNVEAKSLLSEVAATGTSAARLAQEYLKNNFN